MCLPSDIGHKSHRGMGVLAVAVLFALLSVSTHAEVPETSDIRAKPKDGKTIAPTLSEDIPAAGLSTPVLGSIEWHTTELPWVDQGPYAGISGVGMTVAGGQIYVIGGFIPGGDETDDATSHRTSRWTWRYDPSSGEWDRLADVPIRREYTRAIAADDQIYLVGGACQYKEMSPPYRVHGECVRLDLSEIPLAWYEHSQLNVPRTHTAVGCAGSYLVVAGGNEYDFEEKGYSHRTIRGTTEVFDLAHPENGWQVKTPIPGPGRGWTASMAVEGRLYLFGGLTWSESNDTLATQETLGYDPSLDSWEKLAPPPLGISGWEGALYADRYAILVGGVVRNGDDAAKPVVWSDLVWAYDVKDDRWFRMDGLLPPGAVFNDPGVAAVDDTIYVLGAEGPYGSHYSYFLRGRIAIGPPK